MTYNWKLWDNFEAAAKELGLELRSQSGGCVYMEVPEDIREKFYVMCWTPLNKLSFVLDKDTWQNQLRTLRDNHSDFHLEFGAKNYQDGSMYWFPELGSNATKDDIVQAVKIMMDTENFEKYKLMARLREEAE